ncbi:deoxyribonuclease IV [Heliophilum fasciatum]|uniref:Probable endonuclease 4 n=1 Tax=Heliophilum fasciatum TaxID=35700 RepID=A0A4R2RYE9_9FIRM|nr:deoxyribonuclease IV [Heliophilum fasciatum]MCW2276917.1 deoxyribonuclease-4 [Heliophilum fasciatum]TCP68623.1 endonuclease IV [Heliophilum fasciatum]
MFFGAHLSISKGFTAAVKEALAIGATTFQFFTRNPRGGGAKALDAEDIEKAWQLRQEHGFGPLVAHAPYTINMAAEKEETWAFARQTLAADIVRMGQARIPYIVVHPGSHVGQGAEAGVERIAAALNAILRPDQEVMVLLEGMAGAGSEVGGRFEELRAIIDRLDVPEMVGVCLDTCHLFGAGYDVHDFSAVLTEFDQVVGLTRLKAMHFNDSLQPLASRKDRHALIGQGQIGATALAEVLRHPALASLPVNLETPGELADYQREIAWMRSAVLENDKIK